MARMMVIDDQIKAQIKALVEKAKTRPTRYEDMKLMAAKQPKDMTRNPMNDDLTIEIPVGYRVTYTHEFQRPDVECRHMSVSVRGAAPDKGPHPVAVSMLMEEFGFVNQLGRLPAWITHEDDGTVIIELLEPLDGDLTKITKEDFDAKQS